MTPVFDRLARERGIQRVPRPLGSVTPPAFVSRLDPVPPLDADGVDDELREPRPASRFGGVR